MVSICAGCDKYYPWAAALIGVTAGILHIQFSMLWVKLKIDDPLDAAPVHMVCGRYC